ncbi:hypothetical protein PLICRDRAFT_56413 [Plicaturopsis crispa FD-325 SS-3]|nr:hypothetical protein PLICRDRAFT_56413 [Plicaturopsis crispa FD-325 SS-3]
MSNYLPVLLVSVNQSAIPDDSAVSTRPQGQVDYLSHDWQEEDVWRSWRNMTRQKNEIANGMRLENASWRTWWKQRNKLKTVTPETLNWLKDSDVTWLYGPLHTAVDWAPPPKPPPVPTSVDDKKPNANAHHHDMLDLHMGAGGMKPILKHRSISELLTHDLPSPRFSPLPSDDEDEDEEGNGGKEGKGWAAHENDMHERNRTVSANAGPPNRPSLLHTKSDTHLVRLTGRKHSTHTHAPSLGAIKEGAANGEAQLEDARPIKLKRESNDSSEGTAKRRHISFNTFVEQCIAIEKPKLASPSPGGAYSSMYKAKHLGDDDGYEEDVESDSVDEDESLPRHQPLDSPPSNSDDEEDEDDILEMRRSAPRSPRLSLPRSSSSSSSSSASSRSMHSVSGRPISASVSGRSMSFAVPLVRQVSADKPHVTIAPIAPTMLKTTGVGNGAGYGYDEDEGDGDGMREYQGQGYSHSYTNSHTNGTGRGSGSGVNGRPVELVYVPPLGSNYSVPSPRRMSPSPEEVFHHKGSFGGVERAQQTPPQIFEQPLVRSPPGHEGEDAYDYFKGPDLGEDFGARREPRRSYSASKLGNGYGNEVREDDEDGLGEGVVTYSDGRGRAPEVVVNGVVGGIVEEARSRSRSRSRTPSPQQAFSPPKASSPPQYAPTLPPPSASVAIAIPRSNSANANMEGGSLLSPDDAHPGRGRTASLDRGRGSSSTEPRGRSTARSSCSDRERSTSRGTNSPFGSISPDSGAVKPAYVGGSRLRRREGGRSISESLSPDDGRAARNPVVVEVASASSSSSSSSSTVKPDLALDEVDLASLGIPEAIPEESEEEQQRSRHPTPSNSPTHGFRTMSTPTSAAPISIPQPSSPISISTSTRSSANGTMNGRSPPSSPPTSPGGTKVDSTLVGRAVDIVSNAGTFLGSMWH